MRNPAEASAVTVSPSVHIRSHVSSCSVTAEVSAYVPLSMSSC